MSVPGANRQRAESVTEAVRLIDCATKKLGEALARQEVATQSLNKTVEMFHAGVLADSSSLFPAPTTYVTDVSQVLRQLNSITLPHVQK